MAKIVVENSDAGRTFNLGLGDELFGTAGVDRVTIDATADGVIVNGGAGNDIITLVGNVADYRVHADGSRLVLTNPTNPDGGEIYIPLSATLDTLNFADATAAIGIVNGELTIDGQVISGLTPTLITGGVDVPSVGQTFVINGENVIENDAYLKVDAAGADVVGEADVMRLTGDATVRIDFSNPTDEDQITGLDVDGTGGINKDAYENDITGVASGFEVVDAYARSPLDETEAANDENFFGNILFDGTGVGGDGVSTNGAIFLGGLGADVARAGIGNDFLAGGGVASDNTGMDALYGGRNADFFFASLSDLSTTDGDSLKIDGGQTTDDAAVQGDTAMDSDWLLIEVADDEDGTVIDLRIDGTSTDDATGQLVISGNDASRISMNEIEHVDASGNLYGFLDAIDVALGEDGKMVGTENVAIGASSQIRIMGSEANNIFIGGYDNDLLEGNDGDDILMGGNLVYAANNPNAVGIFNDGVDELLGGAGDDTVLLELDEGIADGGLGNDTLFLTDYTIARPEATEAASLEARLDVEYDGGIIRLDLGYDDYRGYRGDTLGEFTDHSDEANDTSTSDHVAGTADQTNYGTGSHTDVIGFENIIATGLGQIDYLAAGTNDPELVFHNQQNFFATTSDVELRGTDGEEFQFNAPVDGGDGVEPLYTEDELRDIYTAYVTAYQALVTGQPDNHDDEEDYLTFEEFVAAMADGHGDINIYGEAAEPGSGDTIFTVRGGANTLYASSGNDILEGRTGNDNLSGGNGNDDFVFFLSNSQSVFESSSASEGKGSSTAENIVNDRGDGVDVIHRQTDAENNQTGAAVADNIWDGTFERDFGLDPSTEIQPSALQISVTKAEGNDPGDELADVVNYVSEITTGVKVGSTYTAITLNTDEIKAATTYQELVDAINSALDATEFGADLQAELQDDGYTIYITDIQGRDLADATTQVAGAGVIVNQKANTQTANVFEFGQPDPIVSEDRLIYKSYEDRSMNEGVDDDATLGSIISLGTDSYAEDLVIDFSVENGIVQTRIAEDQSYQIAFGDLKVEDIVNIQINGVVYELQVGKNLNGTLINNESNDAFVARMATYINNFMDDDTAVGAIDAIAIEDTLTLIQRDYNSEETVFMKTPEVTLSNLSGGQVPWYTVDNISSHEVHLLDFDGRDGALNVENVLFVGEEFINRAVLQTASNDGGVLAGSEAMVIDSRVDDLAGITVNLATPIAANYSVHGDDFLIGGTGIDDIDGYTGDDRVEGSLNLDIIDGGKNYYAVRVLGEAESRVVVMNAWEAANPAARVASLSGLIISSDPIIEQSEDGSSLESGYFDDTLLFQQSDFVAGVTDFTIVLDGYVLGTQTTALQTVEFRNDGAGHVLTDLNGTDVIGTNTTHFYNFENIRTVSGINRAVAGVGGGQGEDTLDVSALSLDTYGVYYDLTGDDSAGDVWFSSVDIVTGTVAGAASQDKPQTHDFTGHGVYVMKVDGVENVIGGLGDDLLLIDETEAAKDNSFVGDTGTVNTLSTDRIVYMNNYENDGTAATYDSEPTVTIRVNTSTNIDKVIMTEGALGLVEATDTLRSVEYISLDASGSDTAQGIREDDVIDVTAMTTVSFVDYTNGEVRTGAAVGSGVQVVIEGISRMEKVWADGNDTVIVADGNSGMSALNAQSDVVADATDLLQMTYLDYDELDSDDVRVPFASQTIDEISNAINIAQYTFDLSREGVEADIDRVDYHNANDQVVAVVNLDPDNETDYVLVNAVYYDPAYYDGEVLDTAPPVLVADPSPAQIAAYNLALAAYNTALAAASADSFDDLNDRVDALISVEQIVASQGESILDLTNDEANLNIRYSKVLEGTDRADIDSTETLITIENADTSIPYTNRAYIELYDNNTAGDTSGVTAVWNRIEGSDGNEYVELTADQGPINHTFNLRGGANEVNYNELQSTGIELSIQDLADGITTLNIASKDNTGAIVTTGDTNDNGLVDNAEEWSGFDRITGYNSDSVIDSESSMRIEASQSEDDSINLTALTSANLLVLGEREGLDDKISVYFGDSTDAVNLTLTGFELLIDGQGDDVYTITDLSNFLSTLALADNAAVDTDTLFLTDRALEEYSGVEWDDASIELHDIEEEIDDLNGGSYGAFDFDVLDISAVTEQINTVVTVDPFDTLVLGSLSDFGSQTDGVDDARGFGSIVFTSTTGMGQNVVINMDDGELRTAGGSLLFTFDTATTFDFSAITTAMTVTVVDTTPVGVTVITDGTDTIVGDEGDDTFTGGAGADTLSGGFIAADGATLTVTIPGVGTTSGTKAGAGTMEIFGVILTTEVAPATELQIAENSDADQIGTRFAAVADATWITALEAAGLTALEAASLLSVDYNGTDNKLVFSFDTTVGGSTIVALDLTNASTPLDGGNALFVPSEVATPFVARDDSADNFVYFAGDSTSAAPDTITDFDDTDTIWIDSGVFDDFSGFTYTLADKGDALDFEALVALDFFAGSGIATGSDGVDGRIFVDVNDDNDLDSGDMVIVMEGADTNDEFDLIGNFVVGILGTPGPDVLEGTIAADTIYGFAGNDKITGGEAADVVIGGAGDDTIVLTETVSLVDTVVFSSAMTNGTDTITGFIEATDLLNVENLNDIDFEAAIAANAVITNAATKTAYVFANGADGTGVESISNYTDMTDVASFLEAGLDSLEGETYVAVINDLVGDKAYVYFVDVTADTTVDDRIDAGDLTLVGIVSTTTALTIASIDFTA